MIDVVQGTHLRCHHPTVSLCQGRQPSHSELIQPMKSSCSLWRFPLGGAWAQHGHTSASLRAAISWELCVQLSKIPLLEGWDFTATGHEMAPLLQCVALSGFIPGCEGSGLSARPSHTSLLKLTVRLALTECGVCVSPGSVCPWTCCSCEGTWHRVPWGLHCFGVSGRPWQNKKSPEFVSIRCKQGTCSMFHVPPLPRVWAQQSSCSHSPSCIPSCVKPSLPVPLPFWSKDHPSPPSLKKHHITKPRDRSLVLCLFVSYASVICLRPGVSYTNVFTLHLETFK